MKKLFSLLIIYCLILVLSPRVMAQEEPKLLILSLNEAIEIALKENKALQAIKAQLAINDAEINIAKARLNPYLISDSGIAEKTYRLGIEKSFELGDKRDKRIELAISQKTVNLESINADILNLQSKVRLSFITFFVLQEKNRLFQSIIDNSEKLLDIFVKREGSGDIASIDVLQMEIANLNTKNELSNIQLKLNEAQNSLNSLLNQPLDTKLELIHPSQSLTDSAKNGQSLNNQTSKNIQSIKELISIAMNNRPELRQNINSQQSSSNQLKLAKANRIPNLSLTVGPDLVTKSTGSDSVGVFVMGTMQIPVFNRQQGQIEAALARQYQLELEQSALAKRIELEVVNSYNSLNFNKERLSRYELELMPKAQTINEKALRCFEEGKCSTIIPINAQQSFIDSKFGYLDSLAAYESSICELERALGTRL